MVSVTLECSCSESDLLVAEGYGKFTQASAIKLMDTPVAMKSNLHDALMVPGQGVIWVANADQDGNPAWKQKYYRFDCRSLMKTRPPATAPARTVAR